MSAGSRSDGSSSERTRFLDERRLRVLAALLALLGIAIAGYLTYVHYAGISPVCVAGSGSCERVQTSEYAVFLGVPVALLGLLAYVTIFLATIVPHPLGATVAAAVALAGWLFSLYLTWLELFVIEAICQWCVASAVTITLLAATTVLRVVASADA